MSQVTRKMFLEEYARQLIKFNAAYRSPMTLGRELAYVARLLDGKGESKNETWWAWAHPVRETCKALGLKYHSTALTITVLTIEELRALLKE